MTLLTHASRVAVLNVADCRMTLWDSRTNKFRRGNDVTNKVIIYERRLVLSITGVLHISGEATDMWVGNHLSRWPQLGDALAETRDALTAEFKKPQNRGKSVALFGGGFQRRDDGLRQFSSHTVPCHACECQPTFPTRHMCF